ncbi:ATP-binding protein [Micromonospora yangpuensis]|uniref:ATPase family associated with various cellular activities (AAA) n=1 Tax=Micromonospora yangpuensis TaxID=683228 RepID=A0A1C6TWI4_9ACTN|nr:ATP-binding protein [Micromonospora yangpuensis]GGM01415.1 ATPase [Micromonospora yangpuensis]SCL46180.1 ATPase family associated with various cellular activities (AAA) [Micromonospora yangpuensis]
MTAAPSHIDQPTTGTESTAPTAAGTETAGTAADETESAGTAADETESAGTTYLRARLFLVEQRVRRAVVTARQSDPAPDDPLRGLHVSDSDAWRLLDDPAPPVPDEIAADAVETADRWADQSRAAGARVPLRDLAEDFALTALDVELLLIAMLPDLDPRYERLYGYLNDDVTRRRASIGLALRLCGAAPFAGSARARIAHTGPLVTGGLLQVEEDDRPFLTRSLRVPDRVTGHLLGERHTVGRLAGLLRPVPGQPTFPATGPPDRTRPTTPADRTRPTGPPGHASPTAPPPTDDGPTDDGPTAGLAAAIKAGDQLVYLREEPGGAADELARAALVGAGRAVLALDLDALHADPAPEEALAVAVREARLRRAGLVVGPVDVLDPTAGPANARLLRRLTALPVPVLLTGRLRWDPYWADRSPLLVTATPIDAAERARLWRDTLAGRPVELAADVDPERELAAYVLGPDQVRRAAVAATQQAVLAGSGPLTVHHVRAGVRSQNAAALEKLARRVEPGVGWDDLVLPAAAREQLAELARRVRHREQVLGRWRLRPGGGRGHGVTALFAGDSGTGKTMSAEVVAADLGLDLYVVDLSTVVDKYVGQTEKNLERIFTEAAGVNGVLLFDEADAIFGKRSEVSDAHDRYANLESAYLLQRMESFDGVAVLTTNLRANLDEAFLRRLDVIVDFPVPDTAQRRALWDRCLGTELPRADDVDLDHCARSFELSGGGIRACAVSAGYLAAESGGPVTMAMVVAAAQAEYRKLGRLVLPGPTPPRRP